MRPMLARSLDLHAVERYLGDDNWCAQQKLDGDRILITVSDGRVRALNREGEPRRNTVPRKALSQFDSFPGEFCFDGELLTTGELWLFDLPRAGELVGPDQPFSFRYSVLERFIAGGGWPTDPCVRLLPLARTTAAKRSLFEGLRDRGAEGLVLRHVEGRYRSGKRSDMMLKAKFTCTADVVVHEVRPQGRDNATFRLFDDGRLVPAGSCSLVGRPEVRPGEVIEVRYLYASDDGLLYQPVMMRVRHDKSPAECTADQLHFTDRTVIPPTRLVRQRRRSRSTGAVVEVIDALHPDCGIDGRDGRWLTVCEHGRWAHHATLAQARRQAPRSDRWCPVCAGGVELAAS